MGLVFIGFVPACSATPGSPRASCPPWAVRRCWARCRAGLDAGLGPTLTAVIAVSSATEGSAVARGIVLVIAYCLGLGLPFILLAFGSARAMRGMGWLREHTRGVQIFGGVLMIGVGTRLVTGLWGDFVAWVRDAFVSDVRLPI